MPGWSRFRQPKLIVHGAALVGATVLVYLFNPADCPFFPPCPFHWVTGLYCPGCGSLRGAHQLMRGNLAGALSLNPLMVIALPFIALLLLKPSLTHKRWLPWISFIILVVYGIVRNLPFWPFVLLAPH